MKAGLRGSLAALPLVALALAGCGEREPDLPAEVRQAALPKSPPKPVVKVAADAAAGAVSPEVKRGEATPMGERVATLGLLNKRNNLTRDLALKPGESQRIDNVIVKLAACERTAPWEATPETGAFVQLFVEQRTTVREPLKWYKVFSGWLFKNAPSLNVVEHPVYDVWVKDCAMNFPGEEAKPASSASESRAAKPAGRAAPAPSRPAPTPRASPRPSPSEPPAAAAPAA